MLDKIKNQLVLSFTLVSFIPLLLVGTYCYFITNSSLHNNAMSKFSDITMFETRRIETFLADIKKDVLIMKDSPVLAAMLGSADYEEFEVNRRLLELEFLAISKNKEYYYQVRFLDKTGMEVVRIDSTGFQSRIVAKEKLQNKGSRYYFKDAFKLSKDQIFVSKLDLNRERGKVEKPLKPVIRYATPVFHNGEKEGIVLVNVFGNAFLTPIKQHNEKNAYNILIANDGYYFSNPDKGREWGGKDDLATNANVREDFSEEIASFLVSPQSGARGIKDYIIAQSVYYPDQANKSVYWKLARVSPEKVVLAPVIKFVFILAILLIASLLLAFFLGMVISGKITRPIVHMTEVADEISKGKINTPMKIYGCYEIRTLGQAIKRLKTSVKMLMKKYNK